MAIPKHPGDAVQTIGSLNVQCPAVVVQTNVAAPLPAAVSMVVAEVLIQNDPANAANLLVGDVTRQTLVLAPGDTALIECQNPTKIYTKAVSGNLNVNLLYRGAP